MVDAQKQITIARKFFMWPLYSQKITYRPNCICRIDVRVPPMEPKPFAEYVPSAFRPEKKLALGLDQFGWLVVLNVSQRNCIIFVSVNLKFLIREASMTKIRGPIRVLRPTFPKVPNTWGANAFTLKKCSVVCRSRASTGSTPATAFGRSKPAPMFD